MHQEGETYESKDTPETYYDDSIDVDITWGSMAFSFDGSAWTCDIDTNKITVTNKTPSLYIMATPSFTGKGTTDNAAITSTITGEFTGSDLTTGRDFDLASGATGVANFSITGGAINADVADLGTIKVLIRVPF